MDNQLIYAWTYQTNEKHCGAVKNQDEVSTLTWRAGGLKGLT